LACKSASLFYTMSLHIHTYNLYPLSARLVLMFIFPTIFCVRSFNSFQRRNGEQRARRQKSRRVQSPFGSNTAPTFSTQHADFKIMKKFPLYFLRRKRNPPLCSVEFNIRAWQVLPFAIICTRVCMKQQTKKKQKQLWQCTRSK
jgi:hypothetical protein